jgi:membrane protein DedA with SNARE-associated domain
MEIFGSMESMMDYFGSIPPVYIYLVVLGLMTVESSFIPFPSEIVIPPAAMLAATPQGEHISLAMIFIAGTVGCVAGAFINYYIGRYFGRPVVYKFADTRFAHFCLVDVQKIEKAEDYFRKHGKASTFIGRFVPVIRQFISIPAGMSGMNPGHFALFTFLGGGLWNVALILLGYFVLGAERNIALFNEYFKELSLALLGLGLIFIAYLVYNGLKKRKQV